ncbi:MAG TPA: hypothetical protein VKV03_16265 [Candidatus Binataceae bacterium]|nr:hypothetical protein [Candidatus Binataceae bacterium]
MTRRVLIIPILTMVILIWSRTISSFAAPYSDFFTAANPQHFSLTAFASGIAAQSKYVATHQGFELEQTLSPYVGLVGRISAYQDYAGDGWDSPLNGHQSRPRNFGVMLAGVDLEPVQGTSLKLLGGSDVGDSDRARIEGDFSSWLWLHSRHPINFALTGDHFYNNGLSSGTIDIRTILTSSREATWLIGGGGQMWDGDGETHLMKEFGPDLGIVLREWKISVDIQAGYGNLGGYGTVAVSRHFGWDEQ